MDFFNKISIVMVLIMKTGALAMIMIAIGVWFICATGIQPTKGYVPFYELTMLSFICVAIELATSYYMSFVPLFQEPPKPIGWRPPREEWRDRDDDPWQ